MPIDHHSNQIEGLTSPYNDASAVTPSDTVDLENVTRALYVGHQGTVKVTMLGGAVVTFKMSKNELLQIRVTRVWSTDTTSTDIVALW
ncbi:MAG: hypothetical protein EBR82_16845 [Caulobacteraceae bacterium]|nr:hypothetical protein [Caulobacteraceae bacterium]